MIIEQPGPIDLRSYFPWLPGTTWTMKSECAKPFGTGYVTFTILPERIWNGTLCTPWEMRKDSLTSYWYPGADMDLIFYVVSPNNISPRPLWNDFIWTRGDERLVRGTNDIVDTFLYGAVGDLPPAMLARYRVTLPHIANSSSATSYTVSPAQPPPAEMPDDTPDPLSSWELTMRWCDRDGIQLLQCNYIEGWPGPFHKTTGHVRESWYFQKDIGMVEIRSHSISGRGAYYTHPDMHTPELTFYDVIAKRI